MNPNKALWEKGDFTRIAASMRESGEALVASLGITPGMDVLDLGCGDGTTAVPAAQLGANVLGVDIASNLVAAGNARARDLGLDNLTFQEGDATDPGDPTLVAQILRISSAYSPPPPEGFVSPMLWGVEDQVVERFAGAGVPEDQVSFQRDTYTFTSPAPPSEFLALFKDYYGPTMNAYEAAAANGREDELHAELEALFNEHNQGGDTTSIPATFLRVTVAV